MAEKLLSTSHMLNPTLATQLLLSVKVMLMTLLMDLQMPQQKGWYL
jgi:hypothetical protein